MASKSSYSDTYKHRGEQGPRHQTARQQQVHSMPTGGETVSRKHRLDISASKPGDGKRARQEPKPSRRPPGAESSSASGTSRSGNRGIRWGAESSSGPSAVQASRKDSGYFEQMASNSSYLDIVRASSVLKQLLPPHELIEGLMRLDQSSGKPQEALLEHVEVARGQWEWTWLRRVANEANEVQFHSRAWIEDHIDKLKPIKQASVSTNRTKDYRVDTRQEPALYTDTGESTSTSGARHGDRVRPPRAESSSASGTSRSGKRGIRSGAESSSVPPASRKDKKLLCPISRCFEPCTYPKKHAYALHIPGIFIEGLNLETATPKRITALKFATTCLLGTRKRIMDLADYVERFNLLAGQDNLEMTSAQTEAMGALCSAMNLEVPEQFTLSPLNSPAALLHWRALNLVISQLEPKQRHNFMELFPDTGARTPENLEDVYELPIRRVVPVRDDRSAEDIKEYDLMSVAKFIKEKNKRQYQ